MHECAGWRGAVPAELIVTGSTLSIGAMRRAGRRIIAAVTAAFVLLCGVLCPCGVAAAAAAATPSSPACHKTTAEPAPACHAGGDADQGDRYPVPDRHHNGDGPCPHCHPQAAGMEPAKKSAELPPLASLFAPLATASPASDFSPAALLANARGIKPPQPPPSTLLALRCALNT